MRRVHPDWEIVYSAAARIAEAHTPATLARSLDVLHVAIAVQLGCREFVSGDDRQLAVARRLGLIQLDLKQI